MKLVPHMLDQVGLKVRKHQFRSKMCPPLKNGCKTSQYLVGDRWSNNESDSVIVVIVATVSLAVDDHVIKDDVSTHDQIENALRVRPARNN
jgi:hypothetical protein